MNDDTSVCAYCGDPALAGTEDSEHAVPAAINGRFTTRAVFVPCNGWAGQEIDEPWLNDPFVLDIRFGARIPDRRGNLLQRSPLLTGRTEDGRRIELGPDGTPALRNSVVRRDLEDARVLIRCERDLHHAAGLDRHANRVRVAGGRAYEDYPTRAKAFVAADALVPVGEYDAREQVVWRTGDEGKRLLLGWLGGDAIEAEQLIARG